MFIKKRSVILAVLAIIVSSINAPAQDVTLAWDPNSESDLAGYNVYRSKTSGSGYTRINASLVPISGSPAYTDTTDKSGLSEAYYVVTAVNDSGLESGFSNQVQAVFSGSGGETGGTGGTGVTGGTGGTGTGGTGTLTALAGPNLTVYKNEVVTLSGSVSDPGAGGVVYKWSQIGGPEISLSDPANPAPTFTAPGFLEDTVVGFRLTVADSLDALSTADVWVTVWKNRPPEINTNEARTVVSGSKVTLHAGATDADGDMLTFTWNQLSGPSITFLEAEEESQSVQIPNIEEDTEIVLSVNVHDGNIEMQRLLTLQVVLPTVIAPVSTALDPSEDMWVGVAAVNLSSFQNPVRVTSKAREGTIGTQREFDVPLRPFGQKAFLVNEVVGPAEPAAVLVADGRKGAIQGFFMVGRNDMRMLDGIGGELKKAKTLYLLVAQGSGTDTMLSIYNPHLSATDVALELFNQNGEALGQAFRALAPGGAVVGSVAEIFAGVQGIVDGYVKITADQPVQGFELVFESDNLSSASAQTGAQVSKLLAPHFFVDSHNGSSVIRLLSLETLRVSLTVRAFDNSGNPIGVAQLEMDPKQLLVADVRTLLNLNPQTVPGGIINGYLELEVRTLPLGTTANVVGTLTFGGNLGEYRSTLPLLPAGERETLLLHVAQSEQLQIFNGVAILNPRNGNAAQVDVTAYNPDGTLNAQAQVNLEPGKRVVGLLDEPMFFGPGFTQVGGHIRVSSSEPVVVFAVFGGFDLRYMSAVEGQRPLQ